ncbi:MAG: thioesterase family protein [Candidatus Nanopelagicales bacterium]
MSTPSIEVGLSSALSYVVDEDDTALALGSGDVPVLATPRLVAWLEAATVDALASALPPGTTSVGTRVDVEHLRASTVGAQVVALASVAYVDGRLVRFEVAAEQVDADGAQHRVAAGSVTRVIVDRERFLARL